MVSTKIRFVCIFLFILFAAYVPTALAQTEVSGPIPFNTTWTSDLSPYLVIGDVQIPEGVSLTIDPGVEVQFAGTHEILVQGNIIANGTEIDSIIFTSSTPGVSSGACQLRFEGTVLENSQLSYIRMEYAERAVQVGQETEHNQGGKNTGTLTASHVRIKEADVITDGYDTGAILVLSYANITSSAIRGTYPRSEEIIIQNSDLDNCTINSDSYNHGITLENSNVTNSEFTIGCCGANFHIISSNVYDSEIKEGGGSPITGPLEISDCQMTNTTVNLPAANVEIINSTLNYSGSTCLIFGNGVIENSQIEGNGEGVAVNITGYAGYNVGGSVSISNSTIMENTVGIQIEDANIITIQNNSILNNATYNIENLSAEDITATDNWWGTIDVAEIKAKIWDYNDNINYGEVTFSPLLMSEEGPSNYLPEVDVLVDPLLGRVPVTVTFTASATDPDGTVELYEWDFDGDGTYDWSSSVNGDTEYTYEESGEHTAICRVTDNLGLSNTTVITIKVLEPGELAEVSGPIPFNTTWTSDLSPYLVIGDVQIPEGVSLTIDPGVEVQFAGTHEILVQGNIIANGTEIDSIIFTSSTPGVSSGACQLRFEGTVLENSQLSYIRMEYAERAVQVGQETEHNQGGKNTGTLTASHVRIKEADVITDGYDTGAILVLSYANITSSAIRGTYPRSEEIIIQNSDLDNCTINSDSYNHGITLENSNVTNSEFTIGCCGANFHIISSNVYDSEIKEGGGSPITGPLEISDCQMTNTTVNLPAANVEIINSTLNYSGSTCLIFGNGVIENSQIEGNGEGVAVNITGYAGYNVGGSVSISNSTIMENTVGIQIEDANIITIQNNSILNNATYNIENLSAEDITATDNWWGTIDVAEIKAKIWDYNDNINYGEVTFSPLLMSEEGPSNYLPEVDVLVDPLLGRVPVTVTFTASATDPDGTVELYEWDFDGDGTYDWSSSVNGDTEYQFTEGNNYTVGLKVSDDQGLVNCLFYKIAVLDFDVDAESHSNMVVLKWGWGESQTVLIPSNALSFLDEGDEIHIFDEAGILTDECPINASVDIGPISVSHQVYSSTSGEPYVFVCKKSIDLCDYNGTLSPGYIPGNPMSFQILDVSEGEQYDIIPETIESGSVVFGDSAITVISSFTVPSPSKISVLRKSRQVTSFLEQEGDTVTFKIYRDGQLLTSDLTDRYYLDFDITDNTKYIYEIFLVDKDGNELMSKSDSITTGNSEAEDEDDIDAIPENYSISHNFPNPLNPVTTIQYGLPEEVFVEIVVLNLLGQKVATLVNENKPAGFHKVQWDVSGIGAGIYFYKIQAGSSFTETKKCLILK